MRKKTGFVKKVPFIGEFGEALSNVDPLKIAKLLALGDSLCKCCLGRQQKMAPPLFDGILFLLNIFDLPFFVNPKHKNAPRQAFAQLLHRESPFLAALGATMTTAKMQRWAPQALSNTA